MLFNIIACVLAVGVPLAVGIALLTYVQSVQSRADQRLFELSSVTAGRSASLSSELRALGGRLTACESGLKQTSAAHFEVVVADLAADVEKLAASTRKQFGRVFAELHHDGTLERNAERQTDVETPEQIRARLRATIPAPTLGRGGNGAASEE